MRKKKPVWVYLIAAARKAWFWSAERQECIKLSMVGPDLVRCAICCVKLPKKSKPKGYAVDHRVPVGKAPIGPLGWDEYYAKLFVPAARMQVLCLECHQEKTNEENIKRRANDKKHKSKAHEAKEPKKKVSKGI